MIIESYCDNSYDNDFIFTANDVENISKLFLEYALCNFNLDFSLDYDYQIEIMLCNNDFIHTINRTYRQIDKPTDVITFALYNDSEDKLIVDNVLSLGQILISCDMVLSQAKEYNVTNEYEFKFLLTHGILHLLGFDHQDDESLKIMLDLQEKMIESVEYVKV